MHTWNVKFCFMHLIWIYNWWLSMRWMQGLINPWNMIFTKASEVNIMFHELIQGSHYFEIRGRSDFSFRCWQKRSERQQGEVVRVQGEVKIFL
jgi:hypothetical protein